MPGWQAPEAKAEASADCADVLLPVPQQSDVYAAPPGQSPAVPQADRCRLGGVKEILSVLLMDKKFESKGVAACRPNLPSPAHETPVVPSVVCHLNLFFPP